VISYLAAGEGYGGGRVRDGRGSSGERNPRRASLPSGATSEPVKISRLARARVGRKKKLNPSIRAAPLRLLRRRRPPPRSPTPLRPLRPFGTWRETVTVSGCALRRALAPRRWILTGRTGVRKDGGGGREGGGRARATLPEKRRI